MPEDGPPALIDAGYTGSIPDGTIGVTGQGGLEEIGWRYYEHWIGTSSGWLGPGPVDDIRPLDYVLADGPLNILRWGRK